MAAGGGGAATSGQPPVRPSVRHQGLLRFPEGEVPPGTPLQARGLSNKEKNCCVPDFDDVDPDLQIRGDVIPLQETTLFCKRNCVNYELDLKIKKNSFLAPALEISSALGKKS